MTRGVSLAHGCGKGRELMTTADPKRLVLTYFQLWNTGDLALADGILGEHFVNHADPAVTDVESLKSAVARTRERDPELHVFVDAVLGGPRMVTAVGRARTRLDSGPSTWSAVWTFRLDHGIVEVWRHRDPPTDVDRVEPDADALPA